MKNNSFFRTMVCIIVILCSCDNNGMDFQNDSIMPKTRLGNEYSFEEADASAQLSANQLYMKLLDEMGIATSNKAGKDRPYPDYFGGAYTDETCKL